MTSLQTLINYSVHDKKDKIFFGSIEVRRSTVVCRGNGFSNDAERKGPAAEEDGFPVFIFWILRITPQELSLKSGALLNCRGLKAQPSALLRSQFIPAF